MCGIWRVASGYPTYGGVPRDYLLRGIGDLLQIDSHFAEDRGAVGGLAGIASVLGISYLSHRFLKGHAGGRASDFLVVLLGSLDVGQAAIFVARGGSRLGFLDGLDGQVEMLVNAGGGFGGEGSAHSAGQEQSAQYVSDLGDFHLGGVSWFGWRS